MAGARGPQDILDAPRPPEYTPEAFPEAFVVGTSGRFGVVLYAPSGVDRASLGPVTASLDL